ncbi:MAG: hypothetical protein ABSB35_10070 [Bryobacteraceae bacterium]|jgi:hypothetical protein
MGVGRHWEPSPFIVTGICIRLSPEGSENVHSPASTGVMDADADTSSRLDTFAAQGVTGYLHRFIHLTKKK